MATIVAFLIFGVFGFWLFAGVWIFLRWQPQRPFPFVVWYWYDWLIILSLGPFAWALCFFAFLGGHLHQSQGATWW